MAATRVARHAKSNGSENEKTDEIEQRARGPHHQTCRVAIHDTLPCNDQQIDAILRQEHGTGV